MPALTTSATAAWCASAIRAWVAASATPHSTDADFGNENVKSNPATARRDVRADSSASITATASARSVAPSAGASLANRAAIRSSTLGNTDGAH